MYWIQGKHRGSRVWVGISPIICVIEIDFYRPFSFLIYFYIL